MFKKGNPFIAWTQISRFENIFKSLKRQQNSYKTINQKLDLSLKLKALNFSELQSNPAAKPM